MYHKVKYSTPSRTLIWQFVFLTNVVRTWLNTHPLAQSYASPSTLRMAFKNAAQHEKIHKNIEPQTLRHSFTHHMLFVSTDIKTIKTLRGDKKRTNNKLHALHT
jgi:site-specific recombinase XerC